MQLKDTCDQCSQEYDFDPVTDFILLYPADHHFNNIQAHCPHCQANTTIFLDIAAIVIAADKLPLKLYDTVHANIAEQRDELDHSQAVPVTLEPPREWLTQLHDDLRQFGGQA